MFFDSWIGLARAVIVSISAYAALILMLRLAGKRSLAKLNAFDLVVTVALGSTLATVLLSKDVPLAEGVLAFALLAGLQWGVAQASIKWRGFARLVRSEPRLLLRDGEMLDEALRDERVTRPEVDQAIRNAGLGRIEDVAAVVLETDGSFSVIARDDQAQPLTALRSVQGEGETPTPTPRGSRNGDRP